MAYQENFNSKLDWLAAFNRLGSFPLDRSSIFKSYASAYIYASLGSLEFKDLDLKEEFKNPDNSTYWASYVDDQVAGLGTSAYVGQIITVYGMGLEGDEISAYIITGVGENASLMKLAQTTATGDFANDILALLTSLNALDERLKIIEDKPEVEDTDTKYELYSADTTDGAIKYVEKDKSNNVISTGEVQVKGWANLNAKVDNVVAVAAGKTKTFVYKNTNDEDFITAASKTNSFKVGDIIYFTDINIPDYWVSSVLTTPNDRNFYYTFNDLEATKVDLTNYQTIVDADAKYATKSDLNNGLNSKANQSNLEALQKTVTDNASAASTAHQELQNAINQVSQDLNNLDVSAQIDAKLDDINVNEVGGTTGHYIYSVKLVAGRIVASAAALPDYDTIAQTKADNALKDAKSYVSARIGDIDDNTTVKSYVDSAINNYKETTNQTIELISNRIKSIEDAKYGDEISSLKSTVGEHTTLISNISSRIDSINTTVQSLSTNVSINASNIEKNAKAIVALQGDVSSRIKEIHLGGVKQAMTTEGVVNITSVSTDLLSQGNKTLILDCLNASLTNID